MCQKAMLLFRNIFKEVVKENGLGEILLDSKVAVIPEYFALYLALPQTSEKLLGSSYTVSRWQLQTSSYKLWWSILRSADVAWKTQFP